MISLKGLSCGGFYILVFFLQLACTQLVSNYDVVTYKNLTDLYAESKILTDDCKANQASGELYYNRLSHWRLMSAQALEYEKRKSLNENTVAQLESINKSVNKMYQRYRKNKVSDAKCVEREENEAVDIKNGCLKSSYCESKMKVMAEKFKIALDTESMKIHSK